MEEAVVVVGARATDGAGLRGGGRSRKAVVEEISRAHTTAEMAALGW